MNVNWKNVDTIVKKASDVCRDKLANQPPSKGKPGFKKAPNSLKKYKKNEPEESRDMSSPPVQVSKKRVRFEPAIQKVQKDEESEDDSEELSSKEEEAPKKLPEAENYQKDQQYRQRVWQSMRP